MARFAIGAVLAAVALGPATAGAGSQGPGQDQEPDRGAEVLRVATKPLEPFVFIDDGELRGFSIDYWDEVAARIGVETEWVEQETVGDIIESAQRGDVDAAIAGISITREREEVIDFSQPYYIVNRHGIP